MCELILDLYRFLIGRVVSTHMSFHSFAVPLRLGGLIFFVFAHRKVVLKLCIFEYDFRHLSVKFFFLVESLKAVIFREVVACCLMCLHHFGIFFALIELENTSFILFASVPAVFDHLQFWLFCDRFAALTLEVLFEHTFVFTIKCLLSNLPAR